MSAKTGEGVPVTFLRIAAKLSGVILSKQDLEVAMNHNRDPDKKAEEDPLEGHQHIRASQHVNDSPATRISKAPQGNNTNYASSSSEVGSLSASANVVDNRQGNKDRQHSRISRFIESATFRSNKSGKGGRKCVVM